MKIVRYVLQSENDEGTTFCDSIPLIPLLTLFIVTEAVSGTGFLRFLSVFKCQ